MSPNGLGNMSALRRGLAVDEEALIEALEKGVIAGAGLDLYEREPVDRNGSCSKELVPRISQ